MKQLKALKLLKADRAHHLAVHNDKSIINQYDEAIEELETYITNYQGINRRLDSTVTTLAVLQEENRSLLKILTSMNIDMIKNGK